MFGIDWNFDGKVDMLDDFLTLSLLEEEEEEMFDRDEEKDTTDIEQN